jgi:hypothetical protein
MGSNSNVPVLADGMATIYGFILFTKMDFSIQRHDLTIRAFQALVSHVLSLGRMISQDVRREMNQTKNPDVLATRLWDLQTLLLALVFGTKHHWRRRSIIRMECLHQSEDQLRYARVLTGRGMSDPDILLAMLFTGTMSVAECFPPNTVNKNAWTQQLELLNESQLSLAQDMLAVFPPVYERHVQVSTFIWLVGIFLRVLSMSLGTGAIVFFALVYVFVGLYRTSTAIADPFGSPGKNPFSAGEVTRLARETAQSVQALFPFGSSVEDLRRQQWGVWV